MQDNARKSTGKLPLIFRRRPLMKDLWICPLLDPVGTLNYLRLRAPRIVNGLKNIRLVGRLHFYMASVNHLQFMGCQILLVDPRRFLKWRIPKVTMFLPKWSSLDDLGVPSWIGDLHMVFITS